MTVKEEQKDSLFTLAKGFLDYVLDTYKLKERNRDYISLYFSDETIVDHYKDLTGWFWDHFEEPFTRSKEKSVKVRAGEAVKGGIAIVHLIVDYKGFSIEDVRNRLAKEMHARYGTE